MLPASLAATGRYLTVGLERQRQALDRLPTTASRPPDNLGQ